MKAVFDPLQAADCWLFKETLMADIRGCLVASAAILLASDSKSATSPQATKCNYNSTPISLHEKNMCLTCHIAVSYWSHCCSLLVTLLFLTGHIAVPYLPHCCSFSCSHLLARIRAHMRRRLIVDPYHLYGPKPQAFELAAPHISNLVNWTESVG
jgi:hypothetical protein